MVIGYLGSKHVHVKTWGQMHTELYRLRTLLIFQTPGATPDPWSNPVGHSKSKTQTTEKMSWLGLARRALGRFFE